MIARVVSGLLYRLSGQQAVIDADVARWRNPAGQPRHVLFARMREFRSVLYYRVSRGPRLGRAVARAVKVIYPPQTALHIGASDIGPGLFFQHGWATVVLATRVGSDCWFNQNVTVGHTSWETEAKPTIGDRVVVFTGAVVVGNITIGDDSVIGANAVVRKDVPPRCVVAGVPARVIWQEGERVDRPL